MESNTNIEKWTKNVNKQFTDDGIQNIKSRYFLKTYSFYIDQNNISIIWLLTWQN